jgi:hypothetical protein
LATNATLTVTLQSPLRITTCRWYATGIRQNDDTCEILVDGLDLGCVSMTAFRFS